MRDNACTYPCRNQNDDMPAFHDMIREVKAVIVCSPINWNNMSARLKDFLDRLTSLQNMCLLGKESMTTGKTVGILINGHEDGAVKTMMDIYFYFSKWALFLHHMVSRTAPMGQKITQKMITNFSKLMKN
jgi:multimeric flavodoxin WrbA